MNGYGVNFWGWGREDDNMRYRLIQQDMLPPEVPEVPKRSRRFFYEHQKHIKALEVCLTLIHNEHAQSDLQLLRLAVLFDSISIHFVLVKQQSGEGTVLLLVSAEKPAFLMC